MFYSVALSQLPLATLHFYLCNMTLYLFVPIFGRMGAKVDNPDMAMFIASHVLFSLYTWSLVGQEPRVLIINIFRHLWSI